MIQKQRLYPILAIWLVILTIPVTTVPGSGFGDLRETVYSPVGPSVQDDRDPRVRGIRVFSGSMGKEVPNLVIYPTDYESSGKYYPVVYLLHGAGGDFTNWMWVRPDLPDLADRYQVMFVLPDGGGTSWYIDSPVDPDVRYETYISEELVRYIDSRFRTVNESSGRAISGLSMGGHGAFYLAMRHPDIFGAAGSTSGAMDIRIYPDGWDLRLRLGDPEKHMSYWNSHTVINVADGLENGELALIFDCGRSDFFFQVNEALHEKLVQKGIDHRYTTRPGGHTGEYWSLSIPEHLEFFDAFFRGETPKD